MTYSNYAAFLALKSVICYISDGMIKTSIRFFEDISVRAVWENETSKWWFCAMDIAEALTKSSNPRSYWNALKRRKNELSTTEI